MDLRVQSQTGKSDRQTPGIASGQPTENKILELFCTHICIRQSTHELHFIIHRFAFLHTCSLISGYFSSGERWGTLLLTYSIN